MRHHGKGNGNYGNLLLITEDELKKRLAPKPWWHSPAFFFAGFGVSQLFIWLLRSL